MKQGVFYVIATPIGNMQDISLRAVQVLQSCNIIACENVQNSKKLLDSYNVKAKLLSYNDHSNEKQRENIIKLLKEGNDIALITDKGTPLISDPGYKLTRDIVKHGLNFYAIPGACSLINALVCSGLPSNSFFFAGFLDGKLSSLQSLASVNSTIIIFESPKRVVKTLEDIANVFGEEINVCVSREMTKMFEEHIRGNVKSALAELALKKAIKGEFVLTIDNNKEAKPDLTSFNNKIIKLLEFNVPVKEIANILSDKKTAKKDIYDHILNIKNQASN